MTNLAIIGAGVAGLAAARALRQRRPELALTIYEQSRTLGGRVATGRRAGYIFDHGAQMLRAPTPELERLLTAELPSEQLHDIGLPVWTFDGAGAIAAGDPAQNMEPKWVYRDGLDHFGALLGAGLDVRHGAQIGSFRRTAGDERWAAGAESGRPPAYALLDPHGQPLGAADLILLTPPAPAAAAILAASEIDALLKDALLSELAHASYRRCISLALAYARRVERPFYALVNTDRAHPISWLALEHAKAPERCPPGNSLLIAQMAPGWSAEHWDAPLEQLQQLIAPLAVALLAEDLGAPLWSDLWRWWDALPDRGADFATLNGGAAGLFFAGDYLTGQGRAHLAIESGWRAAATIERAMAADE